MIKIFRCLMEYEACGINMIKQDFILALNEESAKETMQMIDGYYIGIGIEIFANAEKGYMEVENRKGELEQFPLVSLSVGVVVIEKGRFKNILEIGEVGAQVKHMAKATMGSTYVIDRRKTDEHIHKPFWVRG